MNSTKLYITMILGIVSLGLGSCADFLDTSSKTTLFDKDYYKTIDDFEATLVGCYDGWQCTGSQGVSIVVAAEVMSDNCFGGTGAGDGRGYQIMDRFNIAEEPSARNIYGDTWKAYYAGIFRCNNLLVKTNQMTWAENDLPTKYRIEAETRTIRAILYFDMVRLWGNIPLLLEPTPANLPQADPDEVYKTIIEDLRFAAEHIPANAYPKANAAKNDGRITCYAAKALLARVYLYYTGYYGKEAPGVSKSEVLKGLEDVISSKEYGLIKDFKNLWEPACATPIDGEHAFKTTYAGRGNAETVLAQKFNDTQDWNGNIDGNGWVVMISMRGFVKSPYGEGWGACTVHPKLVDAFEPGDTRKTASIIDFVTEGIADEYNIAGQKEYTGYTIKRYATMDYYDGKSATGGLGNYMVSQAQDYIIMRYSDVLLMAAELGSPNAQTYFNLVRNRAGLESKPATKENILAERRFEFAFEGHRYWDLLRQGIDVAATTIAEEGVSVLSGGLNDKVIIKAENIKETQGLCQIPETQITLSKGVLKQNPGWK